MKPNSFLSSFFFILFFFCIVFRFFLFHATAEHDISNSNSSNAHTSIIFTGLGGSSYAFDIYSLPLWTPPSISDELRLTDGQSINFNGHFPSSAATSIVSFTPNQTLNFQLVYVTQRNGTSSIYLDVLYSKTPDSTRKRSVLEGKSEFAERLQVPLVGRRTSNDEVSMKDRPTLVGNCLIYVSTHENPGVPRQSWTAVYSTQLSTGLTRRLTPKGVADFSPAVSPSGAWTAVASYGEKGWDGAVDELKTDIYLFLTSCGSKRVKVVEHGGWPTWADDSTLYFHRRDQDGWWGVYRAIVSITGKINIESVTIERVTPPGIHAFTPAASIADKSFIVLATRRPNSEYRHIELYDVVSNEFRELTRLISPNTHHLNPFISPDSTRIGYHKCRGANNPEKSKSLLFENLQNPIPEVSLFRIDGPFPSFSPKGDRIAYINFPGLFVVNADGTNHRQIFSYSIFTTAWDPKRDGVVYTSIGPAFASEDVKVDVISVNVDDDSPSYEVLTMGDHNDAFPWPSPDGKWVVFRSGRSGHMNLYVMDAITGEMGGIRRLTDGSWIDTMCNWSPSGDWIAFSSNRENPGSDSFGVYLIHPNGTGLRKLFPSGPGGQATHPYFSPDEKSVVFTADYAAVSAEPISNPDRFPTTGEIFTINLDGSDLRRLTHNSFEDGPPAWGPKFMRPLDVESSNGGPKCTFEDFKFQMGQHHYYQTGVEDVSFRSTRAQCAQYSQK